MVKDGEEITVGAAFALREGGRDLRVRVTRVGRGNGRALVWSARQPPRPNDAEIVLEEAAFRAAADPLAG